MAASSFLNLGITVNGIKCHINGTPQTLNGELITLLQCINETQQ